MKQIVPVHRDLSPAANSAPWMDDLNPQQRTAATAPSGPVLVVAGAGTGKTKTLAYRDAHTYAQLTRFIPPGVRSFFETQSRAQGCTTDSATTALRLADIRGAIRSMWE